MPHRIRTYLLTLGLIWTAALHAQTLSDEARISLLTCAPGEELYARFGHTALRVTDPAHHLDAVFNYGVFDFNTDHFYWKFVRGETWYELGASPYRWFMQEYIETKRPVYEQVLNLTAAQRDSLWKALLVNYEPQNRSYLYNFVFDNCATRPPSHRLTPGGRVSVTVPSSVITQVVSLGRMQVLTYSSVPKQTVR